MSYTELTCISCPMGCRLSVEHDEEKIATVENNRCKRGITYAENEIFNPTRIVTTTVKIANAGFLPVKTNLPVPKGLIGDVMKELFGVVVDHSISIGDVVKKNICGTNVDVVATKNVL